MKAKSIHLKSGKVIKNVSQETIDKLIEHMSKNKDIKFIYNDERPQEFTILNIHEIEFIS